MPSTREIRRRIRSVRNTSQITKALEMISAARLRRAQQAVLASRPYADQLRALIGTLGSAVAGTDETHPLLQRREVHNSALVLVTPDRGLAGALVGNVIRSSTVYLRERPSTKPSIVAVGRKGRDFMIRHGQNVLAEFTGIDRPSLADVGPIARIVTDEFEAGRVDEVDLIFSRYHSSTSQRPMRIKLLPIEPTVGEETERYGNFLFEPSPEVVLAELLPRYVAVQIYQAMLESIASEHSARMMAMHNATENAKDIVKSLTLTYNKARQAGITGEILEISGGAEALRQAS